MAIAATAAKMSGRIYKIRHSEGVEAELSAEAVELSDFLKTQSGLIGWDEPLDITYNCRPELLPLLVQFLETAKDKPHAQIYQPLKKRGDLKESGVPDWAIAFLDGLFKGRTETEGWNFVFELVGLADFLNLPDMTKIFCAKIASRICGMDEETKRIVFKPARDLTPEEEERIRQENKWAEEDASEYA